MVSRLPQGDPKIAALVAGGDDDAIDDFTDGVRRFNGIVGVGERGGQTLDPAPVEVGDIAMDVRQMGASDSRALSSSCLASRFSLADRAR
jgi:hypothetical protein